MMRTLSVLVAATCMLAAGCDAPSQPQSVSASTNPDYKIAFLFEHDGCRVYRFRDLYENRYFVNCGASSAVSWNEGCGKGCTRHMDVSNSSNTASEPVTQ